MKVVRLCRIACSIIYIVFIGNADATVSGWARPSSSGNASFWATISVNEGATSVETLICTVDGDNASPRYEIVMQPSSSIFTVNSVSGNLTVASGKTLDFEKLSSYVIKVKCTDSVDKRDGTATLVVIIIDINEAPQFSSSQYSVTIPDGSTAGTGLTTVPATDQDRGDVITYSIDASGNTESSFNISSNGLITVAKGTLNQSITGGYMLVVYAVDNDNTPLTGTTTVWVAVTTCKASAGLAGVVSLALVAFAMFV